MKLTKILSELEGSKDYEPLLKKIISRLDMMDYNNTQAIEKFKDETNLNLDYIASSITGEDPSSISSDQSRGYYSDPKEKNVDEQIREVIKKTIAECWKTHKQVGMKKKGDKMVPNCVPKNEHYYVDAVSDDEDYCPVCAAEMELQEKKGKCKPSKGKRFAKRVNGKCRSYGQKGKAKKGGDRIRPGTKKGHAYCARSAKIKKCKNPPCANALSRKKWKCQGSRSVK